MANYKVIHNVVYVYNLFVLYSNITFFHHKHTCTLEPTGHSIMALSDGLKEAAKTIDGLSECLQRGGKLVVTMQEFGELVVTVVQKALGVHGEIHNEEVKRTYQVKRALHDLVLVAEQAFVFLDKADDVILYYGGDSMAAARKDLSFFVDLQLAEGFW